MSAPTQPLSEISPTRYRVSLPFPKATLYGLHPSVYAKLQQLQAPPVRTSLHSLFILSPGSGLHSGAMRRYAPVSRVHESCTSCSAALHRFMVLLPTPAFATRAAKTSAVHVTSWCRNHQCCQNHQLLSKPQVLSKPPVAVKTTSAINLTSGCQHNTTSAANTTSAVNTTSCYQQTSLSLPQPTTTAANNTTIAVNTTTCCQNYLHNHQTAAVWNLDVISKQRRKIQTVRANMRSGKPFAWG